MQSEEEAFDITQIGLISNYGITLAVVAGAVVILILIFVYVHFDAAITKFIEDTKKAFESKVKAYKRRLRRKAVKADFKIRDRAKILAKVRMIGALQLAAKREQEETLKKATTGLSVTIISSDAHTMSKCESSSTIISSDFTTNDLSDSSTVG